MRWGGWQGLSGNRVLYLSVPYSSIRWWRVESAGTWDRDAELCYGIKAYWTENLILAHDFRKGKADILAINSYLSSIIIGLDDGTPALQDDCPPKSFPQDVGGIEGTPSDTRKTWSNIELKPKLGYVNSSISKPFCSLLRRFQP